MGPKKASKWVERHQLDHQYHHAIINITSEDLNDDTIEELTWKKEESEEEAAENLRTFLHDSALIESVLSPEVLQLLDEALGVVDAARDKMIAAIQQKARNRKNRLRRTKARNSRRIRVRDLRIEKLKKHCADAQQAVERAREDHQAELERMKEDKTKELEQAERRCRHKITELHKSHHEDLMKANEESKKIQDKYHAAEKQVKEALDANIRSGQALADLQASMSTSTSNQQQRSAAQALEAYQEVEKAKDEMRKSCEKEKEALRKEREELRETMEKTKQAAVAAEKAAAQTLLQGQKDASEIIHAAELRSLKADHEQKVKDLKTEHENELRKLRDDCDAHEKALMEVNAEELKAKEKEHQDELQEFIEYRNREVNQESESHKEELKRQEELLKECQRQSLTNKETAQERQEMADSNIIKLSETVKQLNSALRSSRSVHEAVQAARTADHERYNSRIDSLQEALTAQNAELREAHGLCSRSQSLIEGLCTALDSYKTHADSLAQQLDDRMKEGEENIGKLLDALATAHKTIDGLRSRIQQSSATMESLAEVLDDFEDLLPQVSRYRDTLLDALAKSQEKCKRRSELLAFREWRLHTYATELNRVANLPQEGMKFVQELLDDIEKYKKARHSIWETMLPREIGNQASAAGAAGSAGVTGGAGSTEGSGGSGGAVGRGGGSAGRGRGTGRGGSTSRGRGTSHGGGSGGAGGVGGVFSG
ncbi:Cingulin-like protein 1 [Lasiodiplodia hormozganensis]|uniref:Cingulin-like protein 1 n=1 Tax=Lasiodiplodia hormozganensis TaxID=869390 RepID=A0AA39Z4N9_9PEZI|nr:Cingulin-like protein 1 [Lasiodiplodia hormozganensis]